ncbi:ganglioside induced differentiation associated protein 2 [Heterostelium album PN500]|uniref:Ganglioside induced differentiation associated protein 2 n=1 Tax=Heterostelium pallidum (strain ATCC 26659 / Pp 5 / PN500) TaxID=670386 RepID=D3BJE1_HETP5|nr:ganglioside induced differentiation associated protein 2 [Heterostelium album PN500]EFA78021.1 ganglioside induced differentiation associated protein 2 [Heterostelium album PN500]|eukprot:XP_020430149.1 ganglioside induced differentiation associated protein 2 [Heterostelium album PN500]
MVENINNNSKPWSRSYLTLTSWDKIAPFETINPYDLEAGTIVHREPLFPIDHNINSKMVFWIGEVWRLDVGSIVYSNNTTVKSQSDYQSGLAHHIFLHGGRDMVNEVKQAGECRIGEAIQTTAGQLPCNYVIHTFVPTYNPRYLSAAENALNSCYRSALGLASECNSRTIAFSCLHANSKKFPPELGCHVALRTLRRHLEKHSSQLATVVLCLENEADIENYKRWMPLYFPRNESELQLGQIHLPEDCGNMFGEKESEERKIRIDSLNSQIFRNFDDDYVETEEDDRLSFTTNAVQAKTLVYKKEDPDIVKIKSVEKKTSEQIQQEKIEAMYLGYLEKLKTVDLARIAQLNFVYQSTSPDNKPIVVVIGSHLDPKKEDMESVLLYFIRIFEAIGPREFSIMYFHSNMSSVPLPDISWFKKLLQISVFKYSKYVSNLHVIHPTFFLKATFKVLKPIYDIVNTKITYHDNLNQLKPVIGRINLPKSVFSYEIKINNIDNFSFESIDAA